MERILPSGVFYLKQAETLGWVRKFKKVHSVGDLLDCDGCRVHPDILTYEQGMSS